MAYMNKPGKIMHLFQERYFNLSVRIKQKEKTDFVESILSGIKCKCLLLSRQVGLIKEWVNLLFAVWSTKSTTNY